MKQYQITDESHASKPAINRQTDLDLAKEGPVFKGSVTLTKMDYSGLPGIEDLFREQDRMAQKLSQEEINALRRYIRRTIFVECESVVARMRFLQVAHDVSESQFDHALVTLQKDLRREQSIAGEFRREFGNLVKVFQARERRYQDRHDALIKQARLHRDAVKNVMKARENLQNALQQKDKELVQHKDMVVDLEDELANHKDCSKLRETIDNLCKELLKTKLDNEKLQKELTEAKAELDLHRKKTGAGIRSKLRSKNDPDTVTTERERFANKGYSSALSEKKQKSRKQRKSPAAKPSFGQTNSSTVQGKELYSSSRLAVSGKPFKLSPIMLTSVDEIFTDVVLFKMRQFHAVTAPNIILIQIVTRLCKVLVSIFNGSLPVLGQICGVCMTGHYEPRTTRSLKGWQRRIQSIRVKKYPNTWKFLQFLQGEQAYTELSVRAVLGE